LSPGRSTTAMRARGTRFAVLTALAGFALASSAKAEYLVPPGNSAVNQYTETIPTAGGRGNVEKSHGENRPPEQVIGPRGTEQLREQGQDGRDLTEFVAETAPATVRADEGADRAERGRTGSDRPGSDSGRVAGRESGGQSGPAGEVDPAGADGSSALAEVAGEATGTSSGQLGLLLPLALMAIAVWALAHRLRRHRDPVP
jgi:hypothetical protein